MLLNTSQAKAAEVQHETYDYSRLEKLVGSRRFKSSMRNKEESQNLWPLTKPGKVCTLAAFCHHQASRENNPHKPSQGTGKLGKAENYRL